MRAIIAALVLCGAACADSEPEQLPDESEDVLPPESDAIAHPVGEIRSARACEVPAGAEGACALACTPEDALELYVPEGTCVIYECTLADGTPTRVGGCRL